VVVDGVEGRRAQILNLSNVKTSPSWTANLVSHKTLESLQVTLHEMSVDHVSAHQFQLTENLLTRVKG
jgi:hypothetical protein